MKNVQLLIQGKWNNPSKGNWGNHLAKFIFLFGLILNSGFYLRPCSGAENSTKPIVSHSKIPKTSPLTKLLLAEIALSRDQEEAASDYYLQLLAVDPQTAEWSTQLLLELRQFDKATRPAQIWANHTPQNLHAQQIAANLSLRQNQVKLAIHYLDKLIAAKAANTALVNFSHSLKNTSVPLRKRLFIELPTLSQHYPHDGDALFNLAYLCQQHDQNPQALELIDKSLAVKANWPLAIALRSQILFDMGEADAALAYLNGAIDSHPDDFRMKSLKGELLIMMKKFKEAREAFIPLLENLITKGDALINLADIAVKEGNIEQAKAYLIQATKLPQTADLAHYILGDIADYQEQPEQAINWYQQVQDEPYYLSAQLKVATLLAEQGQIDAARKYLGEIVAINREQSIQIQLIEAQLLMQANHLNEALERLNNALRNSPDEIQLLYARGLVAQHLGNYQMLEQDLRHILKLDKYQVRALNILGYLLTVQSKRYQEALDYIQQALAIDPENPAILDSMGWLQYHMGNYEKAVMYLEQAYRAAQDPETAAHLVIILWETKQEQQAMQLLDEASKHNPTHPSLKQLRKYYGR